METLTANPASIRIVEYSGTEVILPIHFIGISSTMEAENYATH